MHIVASGVLINRIYITLLTKNQQDQIHVANQERQHQVLNQDNIGGGPLPQELGCPNCADTEHLVQKVISGMNQVTDTRWGFTNRSRWRLGLLGLEADIRETLAQSRRPEGANEVSKV